MNICIAFAYDYKRFKPSIIKCFPNSLFAFASYLQSNNISVPKVQTISCTGENLYKQQRELFEKNIRWKSFRKSGNERIGGFCL